MEVNMNCHIVVDDLPDNVAPAKQAAFLKLFGNKVTTVLGKPPLNIKLVNDEATGNAIAAFIELASPADADNAIAKLHGLAFTKTCKFSAYRWSDFEKAENTPDTLPDENEDEDGEGPRDMTNAFLLDEKARPQLLIKSGQDYDVTWSYYNTKDNLLDQIRSTKTNFEKAPWCEIDKRNKRLQRPPKGKKPFPQWTTKGTYLISQHPTELCFWGGASMQLCAEVQCPVADFQDLIVSNNEKYCIVKSRGLHFWNLVEGRLIRSIVRSEATTGAEAADDDEANAIFQYSADDSLVGTITRTAAKQGLSIYETDSMKIVSEDATTRFSLEVPGIKSFFFNPANPRMLAYAVDAGNNAWRIHIDTIDVNEERVPRFVTLCRRQWMNLSGVNLLWHPSGDYLCARLVKNLPGDKGTYVEYCIFRTSTNSISAELFDPKGEARRFVFQPTAARFALLVVPSSQTGLIKRQFLQFYAIEPRNGVKLVGKFENEADRVIFAPKGSRCVAVNVDKSNIEFFGTLGTGPFSPTGTAEMVPIAERNTEMGGLPNVHKLPTDFEWDPTGRYFMSVTSALTHDTDNQMSIWNCNGRIVFQQKMQRLSHANFRPIPKPLLSNEDLNRIKKELPAKTKEYDQQILEEKQKSEAKVQEKLATVEARYKAALEEVAKWHEENDHAARRQKLKESAPMYKHLMEQAEQM